MPKDVLLILPVAVIYFASLRRLCLLVTIPVTELNIFQINAAAEVIYEAVDTNANIIFGALVDDSMSGEIAITVIATGTVGKRWQKLSGEIAIIIAAMQGIAELEF